MAGGLFRLNGGSGSGGWTEAQLITLIAANTLSESAIESKISAAITAAGGVPGGGGTTPPVTYATTANMTTYAIPGFQPSATVACSVNGCDSGTVQMTAKSTSVFSAGVLWAVFFFTSDPRVLSTSQNAEANHSSISWLRTNSGSVGDATLTASGTDSLVFPAATVTGPAAWALLVAADTASETSNCNWQAVAPITLPAA